MEDELHQVFRTNFPRLSLPIALLPRLLPLVSVRRLARERTLFAQGQAVSAFYAVLSGEMEARLTGFDGASSVLEHVRAPRLFGLAAFAADRPSTYEAVARSSCRVLVFGPAAYQLLMDEVPGFARALLSEFAGRYDDMLRLLEASRHRSAEERFSLALAQLVRERAEGAPDVQGWQTLRATQVELAALANLSRQTVNQLLRAGVAEGRLRSRYGRLWIQAPSAASMSERSFSGASVGA
jgi:CRP-like cAMP-binding protein